MKARNMGANPVFALKEKTGLRYNTAGPLVQQERFVKEGD